ncbi:putative nuclease HARBI1 [Acyrthosiphon pisum]|uniref:DDE Tnp4 domain-containing protein n=1 Tax=Acyrthosiphon pisum TaxID=7029 RepID=A0A8R2HAK8_ACYPI|nr:putative nuclease HARBI1 [Acyrthosiphon pisum]|eukprot:XP_016665078.1 PREDICTED: putative nuclease HARBI1 isoform X2 [Acyrthosiphon pisum]
MTNPQRILAIAASSSFKLLLDCGLFTFNDDDDEDDENLTFEKDFPIRIQNYIENVVVHYSDNVFQSHFRLSRTVFYNTLLPMIEISQNNMTNKEKKTGRPEIPIVKQLLSVLWILATPDSYRSVGEKFDMGKSSLSVSFFRIINLLIMNASNVIIWPHGEEMERQKELFFRMASIPNVIGAVDGTFIPIKAPKQDAEVYVTRKCNYAITLQAITNAELKFTDVFVGYPGSVSDTRIFRNSDIFINIMRNQKFYFPNDEHILGDKAYPPLTWCVEPYINRGRLTEAQKNFNFNISRTRQTVERSFALFFGRFRRFKYLDMSRTDFIPSTVLAACVLHNLCLKNKSDANIKDYIEEGMNFLRHQRSECANPTRESSEDHCRTEGKLKRDRMCELYNA